MSKKLPIVLEDEPYTLEYNRYAIKRIEQMGFSTANLGDKLVTNVELLFFGALIKNHGFQVNSVKKANVLLDLLMEEYDTETLLEILVELMVSVIPSMSSDKEGKKTLSMIED